MAETVTPEAEIASDMGRVCVGALGGFSALLAKYLGQDHSYVNQLLAASDGGVPAELTALMYGYVIMGIILVVLGGIVGFATSERSRMKLLAMGVAAPAMITTFAGGSHPAENGAAGGIETGVLELIVPGSVAYADEHLASDAVREPSSLIEQKQAQPSVVQGLKLFFGYGKELPRYRVIVGSFADVGNAHRLAEEINKQDPELRAYVAAQQPESGFYRVAVGDYLMIEEARAVQQRAEALSVVDESWLSPDRNDALM